MKESERAKRQLAALEAMSGTLPPSAEKRLEADIRALRAGIAGEENVLFELKNSHMDMVVLQDLFLEHGGLTAQIDFLVLTRQRNFVLECKNLYGNIEVNGRGDFVRVLGGRKREGVYSPITQNQRHIELIHAMKRDSRGALVNLMVDRDFDDIYRGLVVLANPKTVIDDARAPADVRDAIVRADQLAAKIEAVNSERGAGRDKVPFSTVRKAAEWFLEHDRGEGGVDFAERYRGMAASVTGPSSRTPGERSEPAANLPRVEPAADAQTSDMAAGQPRTGGIACPKCGAQMVLRTAKRGEHAGRQFYGCSRFPECRGIVNIDQGFKS